MTKAKKDLIAWVIWLIVGILFAAAGGIMISITKENRLVWIICGSIMAACGLAIIILSIVKLAKGNKKEPKTKKAPKNKKAH